MTPTLYAPSGLELRKAVALSQPPAQSTSRKSQLTRRITTTYHQGLANILLAMPDPDEIMAQEGTDIWDRMRADDAVFAADFQLMTRLLAKPWNIHPPEHMKEDPFAKEVAEYGQQVFAGLGIEAMLEHLYRGLRKKYAGGQLIYRNDGGTMVPTEFVPERSDLFYFGPHGERFINITGVPERAAPFKWVVYVNEPEPERPSGRSIYSRVYWPWKFKRLGWELWVTERDRFAVPSLAALFELASEDPSIAQKIAEDLNEQLANIASGSVGSLAHTKNLVQIGGKSEGSSGFSTFLEACDNSIYRGILTTTLTVSEGKEGAERGDTSVHDESADEVACYYGKQIAETVTMTVLAYAVLLRFGEPARAVLPVFSFDFEDVLSFDRIMLLIDRKVPVSLNALYTRYGAPEPADEADAFVGGMDAPAQPGGGDGATASATAAITNRGEMVTIEVPAEDEALVRGKLHTYLRDQEIKKAFTNMRNEGSKVDDALDALAKNQNLSRSTVRNIVYG